MYGIVTKHLVFLDAYVNIVCKLTELERKIFIIVLLC